MSFRTSDSEEKSSARGLSAVKHLSPLFEMTTTGFKELEVKDGREDIE